MLASVGVILFCVLQAGSAPDVWLQLLEECAGDPNCQPTVLRGLAQQLAEQRALTAQQQTAQQQEMSNAQQQLAEQAATTAQQLAELRAIVAQQQEQIAAQQQQIAMLLQLSAQQQVAARQGVQDTGA